MVLWFDVEEKGNTTPQRPTARFGWLWFDVEEKGNTTFRPKKLFAVQLWFDVEEKGNTTMPVKLGIKRSCGLM